jgi:hypothetical protein
MTLLKVGRYLIDQDGIAAMKSVAGGMAVVFLIGGGEIKLNPAESQALWRHLVAYANQDLRVEGPTATDAAEGPPVADDDNDEDRAPAASTGRR